MNVAGQIQSTAYLSPKHKSHIESRGLLNDWSSANCRTVSADEASVYLGYTAKSGGILFVGKTTQFQFRPDKPWKSESGKRAPKYRTPVGEYDAFLPQHPTDRDYWDAEKLRESCYHINDHPYILITEGAFKAIAGCSHGLPTIGLMGISMGLTAKASDLQNKRYLVPTLEFYARAGFGFIIAFDADAATNSSIIWEQRKLGHQLLKFNVPVYSITGRWEPGTEGETKGMDDFIQKKGIEAFRKVLATSLTFNAWESKTTDGGYLSGLKAFYELVDNGGISGRALFSASGYQKNWNCRFAIASVEHIQTENSGDGWDRRCIPLQTRPRIANIEDPELGRKLSTELGLIAGWALSMDKTERNRILLVPSTNPSIVALKQDGAILGDSVRSFVDRCLRAGGDSYVGSDLHSWYAAYCKAHNLSPSGYNKFVHHLQRVLSNHWRASEVVREGDKIKRIPAQWQGLQILPCFVDVAVAEDEDGSNRPHIPNWACIKTICADGGLQELAETRTVTGTSAIAEIPAHSQIAQTVVVTDVTSNSEIVTTSKNPTTRMVTDVTLLQGKSSQHEKIPPLAIADNYNIRSEGEPLIDVTPVTTTVTPTFESSEKSCNSSKTCNNPQLSEPGTIAPEESKPIEPTEPTEPPSVPMVNWNVGERVKVSTQYPGAQEYIDERATVVKVWSDGLCRIELDREISVIGGKPTKQFNLNGRYLVSESATDSNLNEEELELVNLMRFAVTQSDPLVTDAVKKCLTETCDKGFANRKKVWSALTASERTVFKALLAELEAQPQPKQLPHTPAPGESEPKTLSAPIELSKREWEQPTTEAVTEAVTEAEPILTPTLEQLSVPIAPSESEPEQELPIFTADTEAHQLDLLPDFKPLSDSDGRFSPESEDWV